MRAYTQVRPYSGLWFCGKTIPHRFVGTTIGRPFHESKAIRHTPHPSRVRLPPSPTGDPLRLASARHLSQRERRKQRSPKPYVRTGNARPYKKTGIIPQPHIPLPKQYLNTTKNHLRVVLFIPDLLNVLGINGELCLGGLDPYGAVAIGRKLIAEDYRFSCAAHLYCKL